MNVFWKKGQIEDELTSAFRHRYKHKDVALTGILLARPEDALTRDEILPHLNFWHYRSDYYTDFFCVGYLPRWVANTTAELQPALMAGVLGVIGRIAAGPAAHHPSVVTVGDGEWVFSLSAFVELLTDLETRAGITYDGSPWLLLFNSYFDGQRARLDYSRVVWVNFREAIADEAVLTPTQLAEHVFQFAKRVNERPEGAQDPVWELSDSLGRRVLKRGMLDALLSFLPDWAKPSARRAIHFTIHQA